MAILKNTTINDTGFLTLPNGTTAQRPASPQQGSIRYNTQLSRPEIRDNAVWTKSNRVKKIVWQDGFNEDTTNRYLFNNWGSGTFSVDPVNKLMQGDNSNGYFQARVNPNQLGGPYDSIYVKAYESSPSSDNDWTGITIVDTNNVTFAGVVRQQVTTDSGIRRYPNITGGNSFTLVANSLNDFGVIFNNRNIPILHEMTYINGVFRYYNNRTLVAEYNENIQVSSFGVYHGAQNPGGGFMMLEAWTFEEETITSLF